jgi:hypothetical protein
MPSPPVVRSRNLGRCIIAVIGVGAMIGAGIFVLIATAGMLVVQSDNVIAATLHTVADFDASSSMLHASRCSSDCCSGLSPR